MDNNIIQSFWSGTLTKMEKMCIRSFMAHGHEFHLYAYGHLDGVPEGCVVKDANEIIPETKIRQLPCVQQWADFFRVAMLLKVGGWWTDMDSICLKPYDFPEKYVWAGCGSDATVIQISAIKVPANAPIMRAWYDYIDSKTPEQLSRLSFQAVGPELLAKLIPKFGLQRFIQSWHMFDPVHFDKAGRLVDPTAVWDLTKSYSVHLFHGAWHGQHEAGARPDYQPLTGTNNQFPEGCLYEQLKRRYLPMPKVSIVLTTYNRAPLLSETLKSIKAQAFKDYEIIVVDDGTDPETPALCKSYDLTYIHVGRKGIYRNPVQPINIGLRRASGDIVILQNAECKHSNPNTIELLSGAVNENNVVFALVMDLDPTGKETGIYMCGKLVQRPFFFCGAMKREIFMRLRGMDEDYADTPGYDDNDFADRLRHEGVNIVFSDVTVQHQWHERSFRDFNYLAAGKIYRAKTAAMAAGKITAIRNIGREWGALAPIKLANSSSPTKLANSSPPTIEPPATLIKRGYKYAKDGLTVNWHDRHIR